MDIDIASKRLDLGNERLRGCVLLRSNDQVDVIVRSQSFFWIMTRNRPPLYQYRFDTDVAEQGVALLDMQFMERRLEGMLAIGLMELGSRFLGLKMRRPDS